MSTINSRLLHLADQLEFKPNEVFLTEVADELRRLHQVELAFNEWLDKTQWVQDTCQYYELGLHRADVLKRRIEYLQSRVDNLMLEFCPEEMTKEQLENWKKNQKVHKVKPRITFHHDEANIPSRYWLCSGSGIVGAGLSPEGAFSMWKVLVTQPTSNTFENLQRHANLG